jgi:hypothetical protein
MVGSERHVAGEEVDGAEPEESREVDESREDGVRSVVSLQQGGGPVGRVSRGGSSRGMGSGIVGCKGRVSNEVEEDGV